MGFSTAVPCRIRICDLGFPFIYGELFTVALDHKPVQRMITYVPANLAFVFSLARHGPRIPGSIRSRFANYILQDRTLPFITADHSADVPIWSLHRSRVTVTTLSVTAPMCFRPAEWSNVHIFWVVNGARCLRPPGALVVRQLCCCRAAGFLGCVGTVLSGLVCAAAREEEHLRTSTR